MPYSEYAAPGVSAQERFVTVSDGVILKIIDFHPPEEDPEAPVMIFVAGWISLIKGWTEVLNELTPRFRTLYLETREKRSAHLPDLKTLDFSVQRMAQDVEEVVQELVPQDKRIAFGASSLGSSVVLEHLAVARRQPCAALLVGPVPEFPFPAWGVFIIRHVPPVLYLIVKPVIKWYLKYFRVDRKNEPEQVAKYYGTLDAAEPARLKANAMHLQDYKLWGSLPNVQAPVVLIGAKTDSLHGLETLEKVASMLPNGELAVMESNKDAHSTKAGQLMVERLLR